MDSKVLENCVSYNWSAFKYSHNQIDNERITIALQSRKSKKSMTS